ncbi:MAG: Rv3654c family TadE-like protein [Mycobacteriales bacterium]
MRRDGGFVTVAVLSLVGVLVAVAALLATLGTVAVARHRAAAAADLAALAGARHLLDGTACTAAARVAAAQSAVLENCRLDGAAVCVEVGVRVGVLGTARARARAGQSPTGQPGNGSEL